MSQVKIDEDIYYTKVLMIQPTLGIHATIYITFDISTHPDYKEYFFDLFDNRKTFKIITTKTISIDCKISSIDYDINQSNLNLTIKTDMLRNIDTQERRDEIIDDIINSTFDE